MGLLSRQTQNNNQTYIHRGLTSVQTGSLGAQHGEQSLTVLNSCSMLVFKREYYLD